MFTTEAQTSAWMHEVWQSMEQLPSTQSHSEGIDRQDRLHVWNKWLNFLLLNPLCSRCLCGGWF